MRYSVVALGLLAGILLSAQTGHAQTYRVHKQQDVWWFQTPQGKPLWSLGVCCTDQGDKAYDPQHPSFSATHVYGDTDTWVKTTRKNLQSWGFNSLGGWSDADILTRNYKLPYFTVLHLGAYYNAPWNDLFGKEMEAAVDKAASDQIAKLRQDPNLVGYFTDNELGWWNGTLFQTYSKLPADAPGKQALLRLIRQHYHDDFVAFEKDWITTATDFDGLAAPSELYLRPGGSGALLVDKWLFTLADRYYSLMTRTIRKYDKTRLILGDRYAQFYEVPVTQAAARYLDVASTNLGAEWNDGTLSHFFLDTLHHATGKPIIITEFYMAARENRSGNKNSSTAFPIVQTQAERAEAFRRNVAALTALPYVIGAHWFQYYDEPSHGRKDGEDFNMGLIDIHGKPYEKLTYVAAHLDINKRHQNAKIQKSSGTIPPAPREPMKGLKTWNRQQGFVSSSSPLPTADIYICSNTDNLYVGLFTMSFTEERLYEGGHIPDSERARWTIQIAGMQKPITVRFGGEGQTVQADSTEVSVAELPGLKHSVMLGIPRHLIGRSLTPGSSVNLTASQISPGRARQTTWSQKLTVIR